MDIKADHTIIILEDEDEDEDGNWRQCECGNSAMWWGQNGMTREDRTAPCEEWCEQ